MIPDDLSRELCDAIRLHDAGGFDQSDTEFVDEVLAPIIAKHLNAAVAHQRDRYLRLDAAVISYMLGEINGADVSRVQTEVRRDY